MADRQLLEMAIAIRMTSSNPDVFGTARPCSFVALDDSAAARALSADDSRLAQCVSRASILNMPAATDADGLVAAVRDFMHPAGIAPAVVSLADRALFLQGSTPAALTALREKLSGRDPSPSPLPPESRLAGTVAIVTGAAQGFGRGIAEELARQGACVVVADLNAALGEECAQDLCARFGAGCAVFAQVDVCDLASVDACVSRTIACYGGVDLFVANAGVLKAGSLEAMDPAAFDLVTRVNYTGYFICAKAVAPWMRLQHRRNPRHYMDIVQINSKSGLEGSRNNSAYAGSKFGTIGLTQSFALELVDANIKVNSICPGNFFDGPLWSDPERGLFVQYLKAGKVPGARTVAEVKDFYLAKVPMKRGCTPQDVAVAIFYLREQKYETGQALPVTGGQVMLK